MLPRHALYQLSYTQNGAGRQAFTAEEKSSHGSETGLTKPAAPLGNPRDALTSGVPGAVRFAHLIATIIKRHRAEFCKPNFPRWGCVSLLKTKYFEVENRQ